MTTRWRHTPLNVMYWAAGASCTQSALTLAFAANQEGENNKIWNKRNSNMKTNQEKRPPRRAQLNVRTHLVQTACSWAQAPTTVADCYGERESHTSVRLAWRKKHTVKVHVQGHNDKGRRLVHCAQRTMLATSDSLFAERWRVSPVKHVHLTKKQKKDHRHTQELNVTLSEFIFVRNHCGNGT